ncbi:titin-like isoform X2 [Leguminivora glycinivorella]|uniref:titin-like isoform X2 n=1 Tax=Leguminivora glycinivorella TaxID=1035111 RepID=UPI00200C7BD8|nr:titin-like isoform X2 [Leguminivora glycinivorella]
MNPPSALHGAMGQERKPFSYLPGGLDLSQIKSERMAQRLMRNAMNQGVPEVPVNQIQSPPTPSTPVAVPNFSCLPVQVLPAGFTLPANPKSLLRSRSNPSRESQKAPQAPQFMNPQPVPQVQNNINKTAPQLSQTNTFNNRPVSMFDYGYSPNNSTARTSYGSDGYTAPALPEICFEAEYFTTTPNLPHKTEENNNFSQPLQSQLTMKLNDPIKETKIQPKENLLDSNANVTCEYLGDKNVPSNKNEEYCKTPMLPEISNATDLSIEPISLDTSVTARSPLTINSENTSQTKTLENMFDDKDENNESDVIVQVPDNEVTIKVYDSLETKPVADLSDISDDQKQVKVVKKQVKKERKVEESTTNAEEQNGNQNSDAEAELTVKLPAKKSGTKVETRVEVSKKSLPDGSIEEITKTITKTTTDGKTSIKTKTETRIIPKEEHSEEEVEEEAEEEAEEEVEERKPAVVKENGHKEVTVNKTESTVTTTTKKVVEVQSNDQEEEEEEEEEEVVEPVKETKVVVKTAEKVQLKQEAVKQEEEDEEEEDVTEEEVVVAKTPVSAPEVKSEPKQEEQEEDEEEEEEEEAVVVKKPEPTESKQVEVTKKTEEEEEEEAEEEEEYEEAEEDVKADAKKPAPKPEPEPESKPKEEDEESEYTEEEIESEPEEAPKPTPVEKQEPKPEPQPEPKEEKPEPKEVKPEEPAQAAPQPERKVPLREPSIPLEKVEDVEIKPIGEAQTVSRTHTENTEIIKNTTAPAGSLSTQTEYNRVENIVTVNRTTKTLDKAYEQITQSGPPTMKTYFAPNRDRVSISPSKPYQPTYTPEPPKTERRHSLLLERLSTERQMPGSEIYQNNYNSQYSNQSINQSYDQQNRWAQEPQSEVVNVSNVKPSKISNSQWYQQNRSENVLYNNVTPTSAPPASQLWSQQQPQPQPQPQHQPQPQYQPSYTQSTQDYSKVSNTYQQSSYPSYTPQPSNWGNNNLSSVDTVPTINVQPNQSYSSYDTQNYQKSSQQYSSSYVPPPWEQDPNYVAPATASFYQPRADAPQPPPATSTFSPNTHPGWTPAKSKFSKPPPKAYVPPAPNQSFVKNVNVTEPPPQPGRKTYYSEYERRYITVPESNYVPGESKYQAQPDPSPQYYYDNNDQPAEPVEPQWRKELREFTEKTSQTQYQTQQTSVNPPWESEPNYAKPATPSAKFTSTPSWSQTLRPQSWRERSFESELVSESQEWAKSNTLGRNRPVSSYVKSAEAPAPERARGVSVDRFNPNSYSGPILSEHQPVQGQTLTPANAPHSKGYHNPNVPAYHARASAEPREQHYHHPRTYGLDSRASPLQSRSFKYLQWITGTEE